VNESVNFFSAVGDDIRFGLGAVRNVGTNVVEDIVRTREEKSAFTSFNDFLEKVPLSACNVRVIESLIKAGAFDSIEPSRRALHAVFEQAIAAVTGKKRQEAHGQFDLFGGVEELQDSVQVEVPKIPEW